MKKYLMLAASAALLCGMSAPAKTSSVEEKVTMKAFSGYVLAMAWDDLCNASGKDADAAGGQSKDAMLEQNRQMFGARLGELMRARAPNDSVESIVARMRKLQNGIDREARKQLSAEKCTGATAQSASQLYTMYTTTGAPEINTMMNQSIIRSGGMVTTRDAAPAAKPTQAQ